jgi:hypothetical protein
MIDRLLLLGAGAGAVVASVAAAAWTFATTTENVSLIGGGGILASSIGLSVYLLRIALRDGARARLVAARESDRADRAEYRLGLVNELLALHGIEKPANYFVWPLPGMERNES